MTVFSLGVVGLLCSIIAALLMSFSDKTRSPIAFFLYAIGLVGLFLCVWSALGRLFVVQCETYQQMCSSRTEFEVMFGKMLRSADRANTVYLAGGFVGLASMAFAMYVGICREPSTKLIVTAGCCFLAVGGIVQLYCQFAS